MNLLLIDNFDSFTYNLAHLLADALGTYPKVVSYANFTSGDIGSADIIVISPGPGKPAEYGRYRFIREIYKPVLGICLGMQVINEIFGGETGVLDNCIHGKTDTIDFKGQEHTVARYHSLYCSKVSHGLKVIARNSQGIPMAIEHQSGPLIGYQFHPESFLTPNGKTFINYAIEYFRKYSSR